MAQMNASLKARLGDNAPFIALIALYLLIEIAQPTFLAPSTQLGLLADSSTLFIMAAGTTFVVLLGSIDLSLQAVASLSSVIVAMLLPRYGALAAVVALAASFGIGLLSGVIQNRAAHSVVHRDAGGRRDRVGRSADAFWYALDRHQRRDAQRVARLDDGFVVRYSA
ncbi:hypothetical protein [Paraburkholderia sp. BL9I2N2]|uniref:hypothetical protein n=1 Tax=Paraburkholderia sp. BL9I2N2 TaxID=1938809 RepID=UPI001FB4CFB2|nr:hypothetical protein [Paraburkholderia sp. BL9I2N2]